MQVESTWPDQFETVMKAVSPLRIVPQLKMPDLYPQLEANSGNRAMMLR